MDHRRDRSRSGPPCPPHRHRTGRRNADPHGTARARNSGRRSHRAAAAAAAPSPVRESRPVAPNGWNGRSCFSPSFDRLFCQEAGPGSTDMPCRISARGAWMIEVREAEPADLEAILAIYNDAVINTTATYDYEPRSIEAQRQWLDTKRTQNFPVLVGLAGG